MIILDEIHLLSETAAEFDRIFDIILEDPKKAILRLTVTLNEKDAKYSTIMVVAPEIPAKNCSKKKRFCHTSIKTKMKFNIPIILLSRIVTDHVLYYLVLILN
jgi:hypothetical protein